MHPFLWSWRCARRLPGIGRRIVLPDVVNGLPGSADWDRGFLRGDETAAHVNLAVRCRQGRMVRRLWHRLLLGPFVSGRVVLVVGPPSLALAPAADHIQLALD